MFAILASVPGKLKTLLDRLTSTRAANLDKLDANITTRAAASTALSNAVWTDARAGKLDIVGTPVEATGKSPMAGGIPIMSSGMLYLQQTARTTPGTTVAVDIAGSGVLNLASLRIVTGSSGGMNVNAEMKVTLDGIAHSVTGSTTSSNADLSRYLVGYAANGEPVVLDQIPFNASLKIELIATTLVAGGSATVYYKYRRVS